MRFSRSAFRRAVCLGTFAIVSLLGCARRLADRAAAAANASSVRLVRLAMELQGELDAQEDHDRWTLQLQLRLECAAMPKLHHAVHDAIADWKLVFTHPRALGARSSAPHLSPSSTPRYPSR